MRLKLLVLNALPPQGSGSPLRRNPQAEEVRTLSTQVTADVTEPIKAQVTRGADGFGRAH
jgi:hypothetical protein